MMSARGVLGPASDVERDVWRAMVELARQNVPYVGCPQAVVSRLINERVFCNLASDVSEVLSTYARCCVDCLPADFPLPGLRGAGPAGGLG